MPKRRWSVGTGEILLQVAHIVAVVIVLGKRIVRRPDLWDGQSTASSTHRNAIGIRVSNVHSRAGTITDQLSKPIDRWRSNREYPDSSLPI